MPSTDLRRELVRVIETFGGNPLEFFWILHDSENPNLDFMNQNEVWAAIKDEPWHCLDLSDYQLWAISDNGDLMWWNGQQTVARRPRDCEFISVPVGPLQFMRLLVSGTFGGFFPDDLLDGEPKREA